MIKSKSLLFFSCFALFFSCKDELRTWSQFGHPDVNEMQIKNEKPFLIVSTNNFSGNLNGLIETPLNSVYISVGGADILDQYIQIARNRYNQRILLLDSGYLLSRNMEQDKKQSVLKFYEHLKFDAVLFTENELGQLDKEGQTSIPFISSNIIDLKNFSPIERNYLSPHVIKEIDGIKIGVIGVTSFTGKEYKKELFNGIFFEDPIASIIRTKKYLQEAGVKLTILLTHFEVHCQSDKKSLAKNLNGDLVCPEENDLLKTFVERLPPQSIDLIVGGDSNFSSGKINGIPIIQNHGHGKYIGLSEIFFDEQGNYLPAKTRVMGPTKLCTRFFKHTMDCHIPDGPEKKEKVEYLHLHGLDMIDARFLGRTIVRDQKISDSLKAN